MKRELELEVTRKGRHVDYLDVNADPDDAGGLRKTLTGWLAGNGWDEALWGQFELLVRYAGEFKVRRKVRS